MLKIRAGLSVCRKEYKFTQEIFTEKNYLFCPEEESNRLLISFLSRQSFVDTCIAESVAQHLQELDGHSQDIKTLSKRLAERAVLSMVFGDKA